MSVVSSVSMWMVSAGWPCDHSLLSFKLLVDSWHHPHPVCWPIHLFVPNLLHRTGGQGGKRRTHISQGRICLRLLVWMR